MDNITVELGGEYLVKSIFYGEITKVKCMTITESCFEFRYEYLGHRFKWFHF